MNWGALTFAGGSAFVDRFGAKAEDSVGRLCCACKRNKHLHHCKCLIFFVGAEGFEPPTLCL